MTHLDNCNCGSEVYFPLMAEWTVEQHDRGEDGSLMEYVGFKCAECGEVTLTDPIPESHASDDSFDLPESADRDMVRED